MTALVSVLLVARAANYVFIILSVRTEGCNRTRASDNFKQWIDEAHHEERMLKNMKNVTKAMYRPPCWKFGACPCLREKQQRLHMALLQALFSETQKMSINNTWKILG